MHEYTYKAVDPSGKQIVAQIKATSISDASKILAEKNLFAVHIALTDDARFSSLSNFKNSIQRIKTKDRVVFTRQLSTLVKSGLPISNSLKILVDQVENPKLKDVIIEVDILVEGGTSLSKALAKFPDVFNKIYIALVESGEVSGELDTILVRLADQEEKTYEINKKIKSAFTYPIVVLAVVVAVAGLMVTVVIPEVAKIYVELSKELPIFTKILVGLGDFAVKFWYLLVAMFVGASYGTKTYIATEHGRKRFDNLKLNIPVFKDLIRKLYMARFARTMSSLVGSGVSMIQSLTIVSGAINNVHLEGAIKDVADKVQSGAPLSKPIIENSLFLPLTGKMIAVGEQTGSVSDSLEKVASYYEDEVDQSVETISDLIEPATMILLGVIVAFLIGAVLLPIYGLVSGI